MHICSDHYVIFYQSDLEFGEAFQQHSRRALERGEAMIMIATPEHLKVVNQRLNSIGVHVPTWAAMGLLVQLDAVETLEKFYIGGALDKILFHQVVGGALQRAEEITPGKFVWAYGEMVDVLCSRGRPDDAIRLEEMWNELGKERKFSLLCGYRMDPMQSSVKHSFLSSVCDVHKRVAPPADEKDILATMTRALELCLGLEESKDAWKKVGSKCGNLPLSLAMTLWLRINHPKAAETVAAEVCLVNRAVGLTPKPTKIATSAKLA